MYDNEVKLDNEQTTEEGQIIEVPEVIRVKSGNSFESGLLFGLGFGLAMILYGLIFWVLIGKILEAGLRP